MDYHKFAREFAKLCPGFETDIHGLVEVEDESGQVRYYADCVADKFAKQPKPLATAENMVQMGDDGPYGRNV